MEPKGIIALFSVIPWMALVLYWVTLCPQVYWRDGAEFVTTAQTLGISHPAGSPTYNILTKGFTLLPVGSVVLRVHLASALYSVLSLLFVLLAMREIFVILYNRHPTGFQIWGMAMCSALLASSFTRWQFSVTAEVYTLQELLFIIVLWLGIRFHRKADVRLILAGAFLFGLSLGAHKINALFLPAFLLLGFSRRQMLRHAGTAAFFFLLGFAVYLYVPFRVEESSIRFGYETNDLKNAFNYMLGSAISEDSGTGLVTSAATSGMHGTRLWFLVKEFVEQFSYFGFGLGVVGWLVLLRRMPFIALVLTIMAVLYGGLYYFWRPFGVLPSRFIILYVIWTLWMAVGVFELLTLIDLLNNRDEHLRPQYLSVAFSCAVLLGLLFQTGINLRHSLAKDDLSGFYIGREVGSDILDTLDYGATLLTRYSIPRFNIFYLQEVEGYRCDVRSRNLSSFRSLEDLKSHVSSCLSANIPTYWVGNSLTELFFHRLLPHGMVFRFTKDTALMSEEDFKQHLEYRTLFEHKLSADEYQREYETYLELYRINAELDRYYWLSRKVEFEERELRALTRINPNSASLNIFFASSLFRMGKPEEGQAVLAHCHELLNGFKGREYRRARQFLFYHLGVMALNSKHYGAAEYSLREAMAMAPLDGDIRYYLALTLFHEGKLQEGKEHAEASVRIKPKEERVRMLTRIKEAISQRDQKLPVRE